MLVNALGASAFVLGAFGLLHQRLLTTGGWFNWQQFLHHEPLIFACFVAGVALLIGKYLGRKGR
jgi:transcriptional regulator GlxA family with amidase domain